jgi:hypothetical protein
MSLLVWPYGHDAIHTNNAPPVSNPHVEVYVGWNAKYPQAIFAAWVAGGKPKGLLGVGDVFVGVGCINYGTTAKATATVPGGVRISTQTALNCTFAGSGVFDLFDRGRGVRALVLHDGPKVLLRADASPRTASVTVPKGACIRHPVPR